MGVWPLLPQRLSYPELIPSESHSRYLYESDNELVEKLACWQQEFEHWKPDDKIIQVAQTYDWSNKTKEYDQEFLL